MFAFVLLFKWNWSLICKPWLVWLVLKRKQRKLQNITAAVATHDLSKNIPHTDWVVL